MSVKSEEWTIKELTTLEQLTRMTKQRDAARAIEGAMAMIRPQMKPKTTLALTSARGKECEWCGTFSNCDCVESYVCSEHDFSSIWLNDDCGNCLGWHLMFDAACGAEEFSDEHLARSPSEREEILSCRMNRHLALERKTRRLFSL